MYFSATIEIVEVKPVKPHPKPCWRCWKYNAEAISFTMLLLLFSIIKKVSGPGGSEYPFDI